MGRVTYKIEFFTFWHAGSGLAGATYADQMVNKTASNLPFIPGKTLKGLLRDAAEQINGFDQETVSGEFIKQTFGSKDCDGGNFTSEGAAFFTDATLSRNLSELIQKKGLNGELFRVITSTQIDENGQVKDGSLRQMEVTVPVTLYASIEDFPVKYTPQLEACMGWLKRIGHNRNRGLGNCRFSIVKDEK